MLPALVMSPLTVAPDSSSMPTLARAVMLAPTALMMLPLMVLSVSDIAYLQQASGVDVP